MKFDSNIKGEGKLQPADSVLDRKNLGKTLIGSIYKEKQLLSVSSFFYCKIISETDFVCRNEFLWLKPNVPSPIRSRLKHAHEKLFWFVKDADEYFFDKTPWMKENKETTLSRWSYKESYLKQLEKQREKSSPTRSFVDSVGGRKLGKKSMFREGNVVKNTHTIASAWAVIPVGSKLNGFEISGKTKNEHIAPFPEALIRPWIKSVCPKDGLVLDPFLGSGTTMRVAMEEQRNCTGIELKPEYVELAKKRVNWGSPFNNWEVLEKGGVLRLE